MQDIMENGQAVNDGPAIGAPWERVMFGPTEGWVEAEDYDASVASKDGVHITELLWARQVEAESEKTFQATARRLETPLAVQNGSQWRLDFDERRSRLTLHWLRVVRGGVKIDQLKREQMRLMQRETQLEHHVIDGSWTLLVVLEDVRPGDVIEAGFTVEWTHPIRPGSCEVFFAVPPQATMARYRLVVSSEPSGRALHWKASDDAPAMREDTRADGRRRWIWEGAQLSPREAEPNQPTTFFDYTWVQVSDWADWGELAARVEQVWAEQNDVAGLREASAVFLKPETVDTAVILGLVREIQDGFRYLSMVLEASGWVPSSPGLVARRRHGDCKDLAWLATTVLRSWGVKARPVLVATDSRERVASMLPMAGAFNHAILEVEWAGASRWFDLTGRDMGGGFDGQIVGWFGQGLVIDRESGGLRAQPGKRNGGRYEVRETFLLDTARRGVSAVEVRVRAEGWQADIWRRDWLAQGAENFTKEREQQARHRYGRIRRMGELRWRDDREGNVVELVEVFEVWRALYPDGRAQHALFDVPLNLLMRIIPFPGEEVRRGPWAMPFPFEVAQEVVVKAASFAVGLRPRRRWSEPEFRATVEGVRLRGAWVSRARLVVGASEVSAERLPILRKRMEELFGELGWRLHLPWGQVRRRPGDGFGELGKPGAELVAGASVATIEVPRPVLRPTGAQTAMPGVVPTEVRPAVPKQGVQPVVPAGSVAATATPVEGGKSQSGQRNRRRRRSAGTVTADGELIGGIQDNVPSKLTGLAMLVVLVLGAVLVVALVLR